MHRVFSERNGTKFKDNWVYALETLFLEMLAYSEHRWAGVGRRMHRRAHTMGVRGSIRVLAGRMWVCNAAERS